jgi:hypothetical protein
MHAACWPIDLSLDEGAELYVSLKVVGQGCEQHLTGYFRDCAASKLSQPTLAFDPGVRKLRHSCALSIDVPAALGAHAFIKCPNRHLILRDSDFVPSLFQFTLPATGLPGRADVAIFFAGYVHTGWWSKYWKRRRLFSGQII